tara:strand:- start:1802 stop:2632 length:831 start_codon:yes stop_codon:yes gene_type:complete
MSNLDKKLIAGGCSFTFGHELSDDKNGKTPSVNSWAYGLHRHWTGKDWHGYNQKGYLCTAKAGSGNSGIARRVFNAIASNEDIGCVVVMWSFLSRYDWAMPRHKLLEDTRWTTISPWDTHIGDDDKHKALQGSEVQQAQWRLRQDLLHETGVKPFAEAIYRHAANQYYEIYDSWKAIIWLQNILDKKKIPYMFTLADNSLFYQDFTPHKDKDNFLDGLYKEINLDKWFFFGERCMGFNQWATLNDYPKGTTHPLDKAHKDAIMLMKPTFDKLIGGS